MWPTKKARRWDGGPEGHCLTGGEAPGNTGGTVARQPDAFIARAEARAYLWAAGELDLHEAVDQLQHDAGRDGLIDRYGQDFVQKIISNAFGAVR
jgi:hypothetical protein